MTEKPVLLIKTGGTIPETRDEFGDFEEWFARGLGVPGLEQANVYQGEAPPADPGAFSAVIVTGSASMVSHREDWSERTAEWLAGAVHGGLPVLGVCFGHQLLAHALGGVVGPNPRGRQIGTQLIDMTPAAASDPLMCSMPSSVSVQTTHIESVHQLPPGAVRLATSPRDDNHAFRFGASAWGLQFHPEFGADVMRGYILARSEVIRAEGLDPASVAASVSETPAAHGLLARFAALIGGGVGPAAHTGRPQPKTPQDKRGESGVGGASSPIAAAG